MPSPQEILTLNDRSQNMEPWEILSLARDSIADLAIAFSGAEDVCLVAMARKARIDIPVFILDTGRLHPETYRFIEEVRGHFDLNIEILSPRADQLEQFVASNGLFSFYRDGHEECCAIRKVEPLKRKLAKLSGWVSGQRRDQSPTRTEISAFEVDRTFSTMEHPLIKVNPLSNWSLKQVWDYIRLMELPYNRLHDQGYVSIGCEPCTRPLRPGQHEREGRWWWEESTARECGLHKSNLAAISDSE